MKGLKDAFDKARNDYARAFCKKQGIPLQFDFEGGYDHWINSFVLNVGDYYFGLDDIMFDIDNNVEARRFIEWYDITLEQGLEREETYSYEQYLKQ